jgi:predicted AlkP superfamily pyrophosphatase or phosphodiesterase
VWSFGLIVLTVASAASSRGYAQAPAAQGQASGPHVLMISMDGVRPDYVTAADKHGLKIPTLRRFLTEGTYAEGVVGVFPTMTYPSHTTLVTGVWPAEHGIYTNAKFQPMVNPEKAEKNTYHLASDVKVESLWTAAKRAGLTTASISWPVTGNSPAIDWNLSGGNSDDAGPGGKMAIGKQLKGMAMQAPHDEGDHDAHRAAWAVQLIRAHKPNFMTLHLGLTDEAEHEHGPFSAEACKALENIDTEIGEILKAELEVDPKAVVFVVSDHGFAKADYRVNLSVLLIQAGLLHVNMADEKHPVITGWDAAVWTTGGSAMIMLHDPNNKAVYDKTLATLRKAAADPKMGIKRVLTRDQFVPEGGNPTASFWVDLAPDYKSAHELVGKPVQSTPNEGAHGYLPDEEPQMRASFFVMGQGIARGRDLGVVDMRQIAPTVAQQLGVALPAAKAAVLNIH